ncbi:MAG TPA: STAS domain-containing protein [Roseiflexaceae bacterium]|nr:STAS domain-containing protein [Roseiflexaceae bacterium]
MTKYRVTLILLVLLLVSSVVSTLQSLIAGAMLAVAFEFGATLVLIGILVAHVRGWRWSPEATAISVLVLTVIAASTVQMDQIFFTVLFIPMVVAAVLLSPIWTLVVFGLTLLGVVVSVGINQGSISPATLGPTFGFTNLLVETITAVGVMVASMIARGAQRAAEANAARLAEEKLRVEQQARELIEANDLMNVQLGQQRELLDLVTALETTAVPLADGVLLAPIVGHIDTRRAQALTTRLLAVAGEQRAHLVVLDISGVPLIDTAVAKALLNTAHALRLLGCEVTLSGISANVAMTLVQLGVGLDGITTVRSPREALAGVVLS